MNSKYKGAEVEAFLDAVKAGQSESGVAAGTYPKVTVDIYGRVTEGATLAAFDIPSLDAAKISSGVFGIARGGTGLSSLSANYMYYASNSATLAGFLTTAFGRSLLAAVSGTTVSGLNADTVDGYHAAAFAASTHYHTKSQISDFPSSMPASDVYSWAKASSKPSYTYSEVGAPSTSGTNASGTWGISITGNAASATKLATTRTLWGQSFNGTANASGDMTGVGNITFADGDGGRSLRITKNGSIAVGASKISSWAVSYSAYNNAQTTALGSIAGVYGTLDVLNYFFYGGSYTSPGMAISPALNVGIGTTAPAHKLHVVGNIYATGTITPGSDERLKDNIREVDTEGIDKIQFKEYELKDGRRKCGFIAQQVLTHRPDDVLVPEDIENEMMAVDYFSLLSAKCAWLEKQVRELQKQINKQNN